MFTIAYTVALQLPNKAPSLNHRLIKLNFSPKIQIFFSTKTRTTKRVQTFYDGTCEKQSGVCHLPVDEPFCLLTRSCLKQAAEESNIPVHPAGTCITIEGPRFSSKAESLLFKSWGGHVINMTTVPEVNGILK